LNYLNNIKQYKQTIALLLQLMADLEQRKLTKSEWEGIENPVSPGEKRILQMIISGFHDVSIKENVNKSLFQFLKISHTEVMENYLFNKYFKDTFDKLSKTYKDELKGYKKPNVSGKVKIKKADEYRVSNMDSSISTTKKGIFEFVLLGLVESMLKLIKKSSDKWVSNYYTLTKLISYKILLINCHVKEMVQFLLEKYSDKLNLSKFVKNAHKYIEENQMILQYENMELYSHQKKIFAMCKTPEPKLILYIAPTGTGKTLTPLGLSEKYKVIFVCAARHVGLALAKSAISMNKKVAFAFGCKDPSDVRLHYNAAKDFVKNRRTGGIFRVDNTVGDDVEIMISDIASYYPAMLYMTAFNKPNDLLMYWDEPTITLDYEDHPFHEIIKKNWSENQIPNVVLSSATLPKEEEIQSTIQGFRSKFPFSEIHSIISYDCKKTIPLLNRDGVVEMPHFLFSDYKEMIDSVNHCENYKTLLRYFDLQSVVSFIYFVNQNSLIPEKFKINKYFESINDITQSSLKQYYLLALKNIKEDVWSNVFEHFQSKDRTKIEDTVHITTKGSHTLTDGPTIYMADDIKKIATFCASSAKIPSQVMKDIHSSIDFNKELLNEITILEKEVEDELQRTGDIEKEKKMSNLRLAPELKEKIKQIDIKKKMVKIISLNGLFVPNKPEHIEKWTDKTALEMKRAFTCDINDTIVEEIMLIPDVEDSWKILLLMGIGVFANHKSIAYTEVMKKLAEQQKLFMIIASTDYIYGTNYQFCHGYIGKDLDCLTQEKTIQALGRIGRNNIQQDFSIRFRNTETIKKLFHKEENKIEVKNMIRLFAM